MVGSGSRGRALKLVIASLLPVLPRKIRWAKALSHFTIEPSEPGYILTIEDEDVTSIELTSTLEQLDLVAEAIEEHFVTDVDDIDAA